eukprot:gene11752-biopygen2684
MPRGGKPPLARGEQSDPRTAENGSAAAPRSRRLLRLRGAAARARSLARLAAPLACAVRVFRSPGVGLFAPSQQEANHSPRANG